MPELTDTQLQIKELQAENEFLKSASTTEGFFRLYWKSLPGHRNQVECFNSLNNTYFDLTGHYKFSEYKSFITAMRYHQRKNSK